MSRLPFSLALFFATTAGASWLRVQTPHFELYTSAGAGPARQVLQRLEQARTIFETTTQQRTATSIPVRVFVFGSASEFRAYNVRKASVGYYAPTPDRDYIATVAGGHELDRTVFHEYVHLMMRQAGVQVPLWLGEGTAEVYSTLRWSGREAIVGETIPSHVRRLRSSDMLPLEKLFAVDVKSPDYNEEDKSSVFYAQSWALVHMLHFAPEYGPKMPRLVEQIASGKEPRHAFSEAFGKELSAVQADLQSYVGRERFAGLRLAVSNPAQQQGKLDTVPLGDIEATLALADLAVAIQRSDHAEELVRKLAARHGDRAEVQQALGEAALRRGDGDAAKAHYERALQAGVRTGRLLYDYALVQRELRADPTVVADLLAEAVGRDAKLFDARMLLAYLKFEKRQYLEAIELLRGATALQPLRAGPWEQLAQAYHAAGQRAEAASAARRARRLVTDAADVERTNALLNLVTAEVVARVEAPPLPRPKSGPRVDGTLTQVDCIDGRARLHVSTSAGKLFLLVTDPGQVVLRNAGGVSAELPCGPGLSRAVTVEYRASLDEAWRTAGVVTSLEFR